jgi:hypothetical protein
MEQTSATWDPRYIDAPLPASAKILILYLLIVCVAASVKLIKTWIPAIPFRLSARRNDQAYVGQLENSRDSLKQWMLLTLLLWGILTSIRIAEACQGLLMTKVIGTAILYVFQDIAESLTKTLSVLMFIFLVRWHILRRIEFLRRTAGEKPA